jgi:hypothetical protein
MRRLISPIALCLLLGTTACASTGPHFTDDNGTQTTTYIPVGAQPRTQADLQAAKQTCDRAYGAGQNLGGPRSFKQCMLSQGWRDAYTLRDGTYPDENPDEAGMVCHDIVVLGVVGSSCSNF